MFPKLDTSDRHLGDGYPLCHALPSKPFLRLGATFKLLGPSPIPTLFDDPISWKGDPATPLLVLNASSSALYRALCADPADEALVAGAPSRKQCTFPDEITLSSNLACDGAECRVDTLRTVQLTSGSNVTYYYEYVPVACVELTFFENPTYNRDRWWRYCVDPATTSAGATCCPADTTGWQVRTSVGPALHFRTPAPALTFLPLAFLMRLRMPRLRASTSRSV